jgi:hypothetical protein
MTVANALSTGAIDVNPETYPDGFASTLVAAQVVTATDTTADLVLPYMSPVGKQKIVVVVSAASGTSPTLTVDYLETLDGVNYNGTAALTSGSITTTGVTWSAVASGPVWQHGRLRFTVGGTTPSFTVSVYVVSFNR